MAGVGSGATEDEAASVLPFDLSAAERNLWGVNLKGDTLTVGPSGGAWAARIGLALHSSLLGFMLALSGLNPESSTFNGLPVQNSAPIFVLAAFIAALGWAAAYRRLRQRVVCSPSALSVRHGWFRTRNLDWAEVVDVRVGFHRWERWGTRPAPSSFELGYFRFLTEYFWPVIVTSDEWIDVHGLATTSNSVAWGHDGGSGADERVELLRRYFLSQGVECAVPLPTMRPAFGAPFWVVALSSSLLWIVVLLWSQS